MSPIDRAMRFTGLFVFPFVLADERNRGGENMAAHAYILINGNKDPAPARGAGHEGASLVSAGKNANGAFIGQKVGRTQRKLTPMVWGILDAATWTAILQETEKFEMNVTFFDPLLNDWNTITMYPGNWTDTVFKFDPATGRTLQYADCKINFIDCGKPNFTK